MKKNNNQNLSYVLRTESVSGDVLEVIDFVCNEFIVSKQTAKKMIQKGSMLVCLGTDKNDAIEHVNHYKKHGLNASYRLEDDTIYFETDHSSD